MIFEGPASKNLLNVLHTELAYDENESRGSDAFDNIIKGQL